MDEERRQRYVLSSLAIAEWEERYDVECGLIALTIG